MAEQSAGDAKLVQYLNEAYGTEKRLETALQAHIAMTTRAPYKKRLKAHLTETKRHATEVKRRIKQLGGTAETVSAPGPQPVTEVVETVLSGAHKAVALAQGQIHLIRGTGEEEKQLKNAKTEYASESEEIATYTAIATLAEVLGDKDTVRLARSILREEVRMRTFLESEIPRLVKAVAQAEVSVAQRTTTRRRAPARKATVGPRKVMASPRRKTASPRRKTASPRKPVTAKR